jgi:hypothetical protein
MKWSLALTCLALAAGCQNGKQEAPTPHSGDSKIIQLPKAQVTEAYRADITNLCDAIERSGSTDKPKDERWTVVAMWLGPNIKTQEGRDFLVAIQPLKGEPKAVALDYEAKRVGLTTCALAETWRSPG